MASLPSRPGGSSNSMEAAEKFQFMTIEKLTHEICSYFLLTGVVSHDVYLLYSYVPH